MKCPACGFDNIEGVDCCEGCRAPLTEADASLDQDNLLEHNIRYDPISSLSPTPPITVSPNDKVADAIRLLSEKRIGCALVVWCDAIVGIFTERDVLMKIGTRIADAANSPVRHFMTPLPQTLSEDDTIAFALNRMAVGDFRHIPIEKDERATGIISIRDVLAYLTEHYPELMLGTT